MPTQNALIEKMLQNTAIYAERDRIEREAMPTIDVVLGVRRESNLTQIEAVRRLSVNTPVVSSLEHALVTGKSSPSTFTLKRYAAAVGKRIHISRV